MASKKGYKITKETGELIGRTARAVFGDPTDLTRRPRRTLGGSSHPTLPPHPWQVTRADHTPAGTPIQRIRVHPGSIDGVVPTNIFDFLTITGTGVEYVVLTTTMLAAGVSSCSLSVEATAPTPSGTAADAAPDTVTDVIAVLMDGVVFQVRSTNLSAKTEIALSIPTFLAEPWRENMVKFYKWVVTG